MSKPSRHDVDDYLKDIHGSQEEMDEARQWLEQHPDILNPHDEFAGGGVKFMGDIEAATLENRSTSKYSGTGSQGGAVFSVIEVIEPLHTPLKPSGGEQWATYPDPRFEGRYEVSDHGHVRNARTQRMLKLTETTKNRGKNNPDRQTRYFRVALTDPETHTTVQRLVHVLVLETFTGPRPSADHIGRHRNGEHLDNRLDNLRWGLYGDRTSDMTFTEDKAYRDDDGEMEVFSHPVYVRRKDDPVDMVRRVEYSKAKPRMEKLTRM